MPTDMELRRLADERDDRLHEWHLARLDRKGAAIEAMLADIRTALAAINDKLAV